MHKKQYLFSFLVATLLVTLFSTESQAQQKQPTNTSFGITASIGSSTHLNNFRFVSGDIDLDFTPNFTTSFNAGFIFRQKITERLRFQAEPSLSRLGASYSEGFELRGFNFQTESQTELLYAQLPLLLQITTVPPEVTVYGRHRPRTTYHITTGVYGGYLLNAQFSGENTGAPIGIEFSGTFSNDIKDQYSEFDAGTLLGIGFEHGYGTKIGLEGRVHFSVIDSGNADAFTFEPQNLALSITGYFVF
jgi:hypothetical protein